MKWNVSVLRRSGECERTEVADFFFSPPEKPTLSSRMRKDWSRSSASAMWAIPRSSSLTAMNSYRSSASAAGASWETRRTAGGSRSIQTATSFRAIGSTTERAGTSTARSADLAQMNV